MRWRGHVAARPEPGRHQQLHALDRVRVELNRGGLTAGQNLVVFNEVVEGSDHYQTMIDFGIPKALQWIDVQEGRLSKKEFLRPRIEAFMKYIEEEKATP